jgi:nitroreductase
MLPEIKNRESYITFKDKSVEKEKLKKLINAAKWSPSCFNNQPWNFIFISKEDENREDIEKSLFIGNKWAKKAPYLVAVFSRKGDDCKTEGRPYYAYDTGMAVMSLAIEAEHLGLNIHQMAGFNGKKVKKALLIPKKYEVLVLFALGYPEKPEKIWDKLTDKIKKKITKSRTRKEINKNFFFGEFKNDRTRRRKD